MHKQPGMTTESPGFDVGDLVTREGTDVQRVAEMMEDGTCAVFVCVVAPADGWCEVGESEFNLCARYTKIP